MAPRALQSGDLASVVPADGLVLVSSCSAESDLLVGEVAAAGEGLGAADFTGIFVPGLNRHVWRAGARSRVTSFFATPELRAEPDRLRFLPLCYQDILAFLRSSRPVAAVFMCAPPDEHGNCSFGTEVAFTAALWPNIPVRVAHINPAMPSTPGDPGIPFGELTGWFEGDQPLRSSKSATNDPIARRIASAVATLIPDGATIQTGLGKVPDEVLRALSSHRDLRLHSGLIGDGALDLVRSGAMAPGPSALVGVAIGSAGFYDGLADDHFQFRPVTITHDPDRLASIDQLVTINSALQVDLFGQAYAEATAAGLLSGPGGATDYARGARRSPGGLRIVALPSSAKGATRIVAAGAGHGPVSLSRFDLDVVVTEHGIADLRNKGHRDRAKALIAVAAPEHREALEISWRQTAGTLKED